MRIGGGADPEELRARLAAGEHKRRKKKEGLEARVAAAWNAATLHANWDRVGPQWQRYILNMVRKLTGEE